MKDLFDFSNARISNLGTPTEEQLGLINKIAPKPVRAEDIFVFGSAASNSDYDSFHSVMDDSSLRNYADDFRASRAFLAHHDDHDFPLGRTFDSLYDETSGLSVATYVTRGIHLNKVPADDFIRAVETGIAKDVSIRYHGGEEVCELCRNRVLSRSCDHMPGIRYDGKLATYRIIDAHAAEMSTVFKGSNPKTSILKARELNARGMIDEKAIASWNLTHGCDIRADMERPEIIQLAKDLDLSDNLERFFSYSRGESDVYWMRGDWDAAERKKAKDSGDAFSDESYPIKTQKDVEDAMHLAGSSKHHSKESVHAHIKKMVKKLGLKMPKELEDESRSYIERFNVIMDKTRDVKDGIDPSGDECGTPGCTLKKGHDGEHNNKERAFKGTDAEKTICDVFLDYVKTRGATTSPDNLARIKEFLERAENGEHPKPPYDAMQEHVDADNKDNDDAHDTKKRFLAPTKTFSSVTEFLKTRSEMTNKAGPMAAMAKGTPDAFSKGHNAGLMYPSTDPLQNVPSETWHLVDGEPTPNDADKGAGAGVASISNPLIEIRPDGTVNLLLDGSAKVHGEASANGVVPMRMEGSDAIEEVPFKSIIVPFRAQDLQNLVSMASEGLLYRRQLEFDAIRYGMTRDEGRFDVDLQMRIMRSLPSLQDVREYVNQLREGAMRKLEVNGVTDKAIADFGLISTRQTHSGTPVNPDKLNNLRTLPTEIDGWDHFAV